jgi:hypothetical protein
MYVNAKLILVETMPGIRGRGMMGRAMEFKDDMFDTL